MKMGTGTGTGILMFNGYRKEASDLFWELQFNNERPWFLAHKEQFDELITKPTKELGAETAALLKERFPLENLELHVSRIYRDARRLFGRGPYKDNLWFSIESPAKEDSKPGFFFEIRPEGWCCGMGFWCARADEMENFRKSVDANPERFRRLAEEIARLDEFVIEGPVYKRPKGDYGELVNEWYNRRSFSLIRSGDFEGELLEARLPAVLADDFTKLMPMYDYLNQFCLRKS